MMNLKKTLLLSLLSVAFTPSIFAQDEVVHNFINHRGQDLFISGINVAWMSYGYDLTNFDAEQWETICDELTQTGGNALRWWIHVDGRSTPTYDATTDFVTGIDEKALDNLALAMDIAATKGVVVSLCLWAHGMLCIDDGDKGSIQAINRVRRNLLLLQNPDATKSYIDNALIPMVEKLKNHTAVLCWEIFNEPEALANGLGAWSNFEHVDMSCIQRFVNQCAGAIHRTDPKAKVSNGNWTLLSTINYPAAGCKSYYDNESLFNAGQDSDGYLDFYMFHYYPSERGSEISPFHKTYDFYNSQSESGIGKNIIVGEFPAQGIIKIKGTTFLPRKQLTATESMLWLYNNGYSGGFGWTYTAHDGYGGLKDMMEGMDSLRRLDPDHIIVKHDPEFNYIPRITKKFADTVLFKNSEKIEQYANVNNYFEDDENDVLTYSTTSTGAAIAELSTDGFISISTLPDSVGYGTITITATDKGGKKIEQSFYILVREETYSSDNKLYKAFVSCSSVEEDQYMQYYVNDGIDTTRWSSQYTDDEFLQFDMLKENPIRRIVLNWEWNTVENKGAYGDAYTIEVSNDGNIWTSVFTVKQGQIKQSNIVLRKDNEDPIICRYIRIHFTARATSWGYSLSEVQAYDYDNAIANDSKIKINTRTKYLAANVNEDFKYQILRSYFVDANNDVLSLSAIGLPTWLAFDPQTGYLTGKPLNENVGSYIIQLQAEDFFGVKNSYELEIEVVNPNTAIPEIENTIGIFPNPCATDSFSITLPNIEGKALASFTNIDGKLAAIKYVTFSNGHATCLTDGLAKGVYAITIRVNGETFKSKVIIE